MKAAVARVWVAFIVAPLVPSAILLLLPMAASTGAVWAARFALPFSLGAAVLIGVPLHMLFRKLRWTSAMAYVGIGACCGFAAAVALFAGTVIQDMATHELVPLRSTAVFTVIFCMFGMVAGVAFWAIARPDRH